MKKTPLLILLILVLAVPMLMLSGCGGTVVIPAPAWARTETFVYNIKENGAKIGTLTVETQELSKGTYTIEKLEGRSFKIDAGTDGLRYKQTARDLNGNVIMESESIMNGFTSIGGYTKVNYKDTAYEVKSYKDGKYFKYWLNGVEQKKIKVSKGYLDNGLMYAYIRAYSEIDAGYTQNVVIIDPIAGSAENFVITAEASLRTNFTFDRIKPDDSVKTETVPAVHVSFSKSEKPVGTPIYAYYTHKDFRLYGDTSVTSNYSYHIPVKMVENNLTYELVSAKVF